MCFTYNVQLLTLNLKLNQKAEKSYLNIDNSKVKETFDWEPKHYLK